MATLQTVIRTKKNEGGDAIFYPNIVSYKNIGNDELINYMVQNAGINRVSALNAVWALRRLIENYLMKGHTVQIPQLGTFRLSAICKGVKTLEECDPSIVERIKIVYTPINSVKSACKAVKFNAAEQALQG